MIVPTLIMFILGPDCFSEVAKDIETYIKRNNPTDERFVPTLKHIDESAYMFLH